MRAILSTAIVSGTLLVAAHLDLVSAEDLRAQWRNLYDGAVSAYNRGDYDEGVRSAEQALDLAKRAFGGRERRTLLSISHLAALYSSQGRYSQAEPLYDQALQLSRELSGETHPDTLTSVNNLGMLHLNRGRYGKAEPLLEQALQLSREVLGETDPITLTSLNNLGLLYYNQGRYGRAEPLLEHTLQLRFEILGDQHLDTLTSLGNLGSLYMSQGRYGEAEPLLEHALERRLEMRGAPPRDTLSSLNNLAALYEKQGRYSNAEVLYEQAVRLCREYLGDRHPDTLGSLNNLASLYESQGRYDDAEPLYKQALQLSRAVLGDTHPDTLGSLNNLAFLYERQGRYVEAEQLLVPALQLRREILGDQHPDTLGSINNLAHLHNSQGQYGEAEPLYEEALRGARTSLGRAHPSTLRYQLNRAVNLVALGRLDMAASLLRQMEYDLLTWLGPELYSTEAAAVRRQLVASQANYQHLALSLAVRPGADTAAAELAASAVLRFKGLQAEEEAYLARIARRWEDARARGLAVEIADLRAGLARAFHGGATKDEVMTLARQLEAKELALGRISRDYEQHLQVRNANLDDLRGRMPPHTGLLEIREYQPVNLREGTLSAPRWAGVLVVGFEILRVVDLGPAEDSAPTAAALLHPDDADAAEEASRALYDQFLAPLADDLARVDTLYLAPDGVLHLVPFARLRTPHGRYLAEVSDIRLLQTGRDLLRPAPDRPAKGLLALGGIDFEQAETETAALEPAAGPSQVSPFLSENRAKHLRSLTQDTFRDGFAFLRHSGEEVTTVARLYRLARRNEPVDVWVGPQATEPGLKALVSPPRVLHLATHGFYRPPAEAADLPMLLAGVSLAGANQALQDKTEDGILYAIEAQDLNLEGTELVVLSACETARGQIDYGEGVYGLVRALRTAGAQNVMVTLRPVGDQAARDFMERFYRHWLSQDRSDPAAALRATHIEHIRNTDPAVASPDTWAPFVLVMSGANQ
jgi:CHAT domain-containing protein/tetratricopeptide (TPR) repeat protein